MEDLIKKCKGSIYISINEHKNLYQKINDYILDINNRNEEIEPELAERMIKEDTFIQLMFYPDTPIGFYSVYGTTIDEVIKKANKILELNN